MPVPTAPIFTVDGFEIGSSVHLTWSDADAGASSVDAYRINRRVNDGDWGVIFTSASAAITDYFDQGTAVGDLIAYTIQAHNIVGWSAVSAEQGGISQGPAAAPTPAALPMYDTLEVADGIAAALPGLRKYKAADVDARTAGLVMATMDIDAGGPWQGRKYDLWTPQVHQFPRVPYQSSGEVMFYGSVGAWLAGGFAGVQIWDWDYANKVAIVPPAVLQAWVIQADAIIDGRLPKLLEDLRLGISSKSTGSIAVAYRDLQRGRRDRLCAMAAGLMEQYLLRQGRLL